MQHPILTAHQGGRAVTQEQEDHEALDAWRTLVDAVEEGLTLLHPLHPERDEWLVMLQAFREAAHLPQRPSLSLSG